MGLFAHKIMEAVGNGCRLEELAEAATMRFARACIICSHQSL